MSYLSMRRSYRGVRFWLENVRKEILFTKPKFHLHSSGDSGVIKKFRSKGAGSTNENVLNNLHSCSLIRSPTCSRYGVKKMLVYRKMLGTHCVDDPLQKIDNLSNFWTKNIVKQKVCWTKKYIFRFCFSVSCGFFHIY